MISFMPSSSGLFKKADDRDKLHNGLEPAYLAPVHIIRPNRNIWQRLADIWHHRELLMFLIRKEVHLRYSNSVLGLAWSMLNPALTLAIYWIVFEKVLRNGIPNFVVFLFAGILVWNLFSTSVLGATGTLVANSGIVKKVAFPREILAIASVGAASVLFFFQALVVAIGLIILNSGPAWGYLPLIPLAIVVLLVFSTALGIFLSAVNVYFRDTQHLVEVMMLALFWAEPIVYPYKSVAAIFANHPSLFWLKWIYLANPLAGVVLAFQRFLYAHVNAINTVTHQPMAILPTRTISSYAELLGIVLVVCIALLIGAIGVFAKLAGNLAEEL